MVTIKNTNELYGDAIEFSGATIADAVSEMQSTIRACGEEFSDAIVTDEDFEIVAISREDFVSSADSRETSPEIMEAIWYVAGGNSERAEEIWRDGGTEPEMIAIEERATNNGGVDKNTLYWGASGNAWYLV